MKLIGSYLITEVDGEQFAVPVGAAAEKVHGLIRLNDTGRDILQGLMDGKSEEEIAAGLHETYADVDSLLDAADLEGKSVMVIPNAGTVVPVVTGEPAR